MGKAILPAIAIGVVRFPFDIEEPTFATGALNVNSGYKRGEKKERNFLNFGKNDVTV